jgi:hypothetical protein
MDRASCMLSQLDLVRQEDIPKFGNVLGSGSLSTSKILVPS